MRERFRFLMVLAILAGAWGCDPAAGPLPDPSGSPSPGPSPAAGPLVVDHRNYDPSGLSAAQIQAAAALDVYFEHASVGQDIVGNATGDSSAGQDSGGSNLCGLALLQAVDARYLAARVSWSGTSDPAWFDTHDGVADNHRGNPSAAAKLSGFQTSVAGLAAKLDVASFKFCWIDTPGDGLALFASVKAAMEALQASQPGLSLVWWTMPIACELGEAERQAYNDAVRAHCRANRQWLLDIAALESHNEAGALRQDAAGNELLWPEYAMDTGGDNHLNALGKLKLAKAWWRLMAAIAESRQAAP